MERLGKLTKENPSYLQAREREITEAYEEMMELVNELEQSAIRYKKLNDEIRPEISMAFRELKKRTIKKR